MEEEVRTIYTHLINKVRFSVPKQAMLGILAERGLYPDESFDDCDKDKARLAYADTLKWFLLGPGKVNNTSDTDNGWSHSEGGFDISSEDRKNMTAEANAIYAELEPSSMLKRRSAFRVYSHGIKRATLDMEGMPRPHIIK